MTDANDDTLPFQDWNEPISELGENARERRRHATAGDLAQLANALDLVKVERLSAIYRIKPQSRARFQVEGEVEADVVQTCVVSLDPVAGHVRETFSLELWPEADLPEAPTGEMVIADILDIEGYTHGVLPLGRIIYETFAAGLDPNPRSPDAAFDWRDPKAAAGADDSKPNPFAALKNLKLGPGKS